MEDEGGLWYKETFTEDQVFLYKLKRVYYSGRTKFQKVDIVETGSYGKALFLDSKMQSAELDEFIFHEALVHPPMVLHPYPKRVLIIGGGEGATLREVLKHNSVEEAVMVDIDEELVNLCKEYMPEWSSGAFDDPRVKLVFDDARKFVFETDGEFDVIISDLTEPLEGGPSVYLFTREFYGRLKDILTSEGTLSIQSGSVDLRYMDLIASIRKTLQDIFEEVESYRAFVYSFQMLWGFTLASKGDSPLSLREEEIKRRLDERGVKDLKFFTPDYYSHLFEFPKYLRTQLERGRVLTDDEPFIWTA